MSRYAHLAARWVWFWMLWLIRRPYFRRAQQRLGPPNKKSAAYKSEKWARRNGLLVLTVAMNVLFGATLLTVIFVIVTQLYISGALQVPDEVLTKR